MVRTSTLCHQPLRKKGPRIQEKGVEGDTNQSKEELVITEAYANTRGESYPLVEKVGKKSVERVNVCRIFK